MSERVLATTAAGSGSVESFETGLPVEPKTARRRRAVAVWTGLIAALVVVAAGVGIWDAVKYRFIPKRFGVETLREAIGKVMNGDVWVPADVDLSAAADPDMTKLRDRLVTLTPQQVRVLMMLSEGLLNKQIAYELGVSEATIKAHVSAILQKLGVESRTQAVIAAARIAGGEWKQADPAK